MSPMHRPDSLRRLLQIHSSRRDVQRMYAPSPEDLGPRRALKLGFRHANYGDLTIKGLKEMLSKARPIPEHHITVNDHLIRSFVDLLKQLSTLTESRTYLVKSVS